MKNFVDYKWLSSNLDRENLIILDVRSGDESVRGLDIYKEGHIRNAQYVSEDILIGEVNTHGGRSPLPKLEKFVEDMKNLGMNDDSMVVVYDEEDMTTAGRLWWILRYIGKDNVYVLNGGFKKWKNNNEEITTIIPTIDKSHSLTLNVNHKINVDMEYVKKALNKDSSAVVDARANERYMGEVEPLDRIPGHLPNALNYPWGNLVKDGEIISLDKVKEYFKELENYDEIIVHCGSGITATINIMLMEEIGLEPKHYAGGYSDWVSYEDNEVVEEK